MKSKIFCSTVILLAVWDALRYKPSAPSFAYQTAEAAKLRKVVRSLHLKSVISMLDNAVSQKPIIIWRQDNQPFVMNISFVNYQNIWILGKFIIAFFSILPIIPQSTWSKHYAWEWGLSGKKKDLKCVVLFQCLFCQLVCFRGTGSTDCIAL